MFLKKKPPAPTARRQTTAQTSKNKAVFSYYQNRDEQPDGTKSRSKPSLITGITARARHIPSVIAAALIVLSIGYALTLSDTPRVSIVNDRAKTDAVSGFLRPPSEYQQAAQKMLQQSVLSRNKLTLDTEALERQLQDDFSEITNVAVVLPLVSRTPVVYVQIAEPVLLLESGTKKFVIDEKGRALIDAAQVGNLQALQLITVTDAAQLDIQPGSQVLTGKDTVFMRTIRDQLRAKGINVARMALPARASEVHVYIEGKPYFIKFTTTSDVLQQVGTYLALTKHLEGKGVIPAEYIDVRVPERAYYK